MADKTNSSLFTHSDGSAVVFYMRPCAERQSIRPLINQHGGKVTLNLTPNCIKLAEKGSIVSDKDYLSTKYVDDCVKEMKLLDKDKYRIKPGTVAPANDNESTISDISLSPADYIEEGQARELKERTKYTREEDIAIMSYLITENMYNDASGLKVWKDMEKLKITSHTAMSMNTRYRKIILPNIRKYAADIDRSWISKLTGVIQPPGRRSFDVEDLFKTRKTRSEGQNTAPSKRQKSDNEKVDSKPIKKLYKQLDFVKSKLDKNKTANDCVALYMSNENQSTGTENSAPTRNSALNKNIDVQPSHTETSKKVSKKAENVTKSDSAQDDSFEMFEVVNKSKRSVKQKKGDSIDPDVDKVTSSVEETDTAPVVSGIKTRGGQRRETNVNLPDKSNDSPGTGKRKRKTDQSDATLTDLDVQKKVKTDKFLTNNTESITNDTESNRIEGEANDSEAIDSMENVVDSQNNMDITEIHDTTKEIPLVKDGKVEKEVSLAESTSEPNDSSEPKTSTPKRTEAPDIDTETDSEEECRNFCKEISAEHGLSYETVRCLLYACNGNTKRVCSYIQYGPYSCYPPPWSVRDDELIDDQRNFKHLMCKYGAKDVRDRLLFLEGLDFM